MSTLPIYVWAMVLVGLIGTTATICVMLWRGALTAGLGRGTATRVAAAVAILWGAWVLASVLRHGLCISRLADEVCSLAIRLIYLCLFAVAAVYPYPGGVAHLGPARRAVAVDGAADLSGGRRDLSGVDGVGQAAGLVLATRWAGRHSNRGRGRVCRTQPRRRQRSAAARCGSPSWASSTRRSPSVLVSPRRSARWLRWLAVHRRAISLPACPDPGRDLAGGGTVPVVIAS